VLYSVKLEDNVITLECVKMRDGNPPEPLHLTLRPAGDSCVVVAASASAITPASLSSRQQHALTALREIVVDEGVSYSRWKEASHLAPATFDRAVPVLVRGLHVMKTGRGRSARYVPADVALTITSPSFHPHEGDPRSPSSPSHPFRGDGVMARVESAETERLPGQGDAFEGSL